MVLGLLGARFFRVECFIRLFKALYFFVLKGVGEGFRVIGNLLWDRVLWVLWAL